MPFWRKALYYHYYEHSSEHDVSRHYVITTVRYKLIYCTLPFNSMIIYIQ
ncbi:sulfatase/phosphatase domain-containing protein [Flavobacterium sp. ARAG 55.4]|uniref:Sulfatase/phosphatase domain-containing protein n=1 Tax=Flavobacterium plantiphilum TaxID=3163297 RepID=A0ABW8XW22_9FLAO